MLLQRGSSDIAEKSTAPPPNTQLSIRERMITQVTPAADSQLNEVDQFFLGPKESVKRDVLEFWSMSESRYPSLYRIAKDVLAAQASSVPSESAFSGGGRYVTVLRNRPETEGLQAMLCLNSWTVVFEAMVPLMTDDE
ncbi:hypothetical protein RvY_11838 [Ramazzottius varieornatus]|uniref:HAT C-terminal dimerisation domain-containing protein n=1 Tax=Ramazzottius varieornatus TaxID=947166 RepID=A0A1D1VJG0_RAMVA|nr:hypothetical protein RvY_11838 [Ramazzottius varieornatus]